MDVAIISCHECFFSQRAENQIRRFLDTMDYEGQKIELLLKSYDLKDIDHQNIATEVHRAKIQIVIISNHLVDYLRHEATARKKMSPINRVLRSKRVIALLVQSSAEDIVEFHQSVLTHFHEWHTIELVSINKLENESFKKLAEQIFKIYNVELSNCSNFSIFPTKVTRAKPKIAIMFKKEIQSSDTLRIEISCGKQTQILDDLRATNPCTALIRLPDIFCTNRACLIEITPFVNNQRMGTKLAKFEHHGKYTEDDIIERMVQMLPGFTKVLDDHISQTLSKNFRLCEDFSLDPSLELLNDTLISKEDDFPTVMHFASYYGLEQTVWTLLEEGDGLEQCTVKNHMNESPIDIAQAKGYGSNICQMIKDYQEVTFKWKAFQIAKDLIERESEERLRNGEVEEKVNENSDPGSPASPTDNIEIMENEVEEIVDEIQEEPQIELQDPNSNITITASETEHNPEPDDPEKRMTNIVISEPEIEETTPETVPNERKESIPTISSTNHLILKQNEFTDNTYLMMGGSEAVPPLPPAKSIGIPPSTSTPNYYELLNTLKRNYARPPSGEPRPVIPPKTTEWSQTTGGGNSPILMKKKQSITNDRDGYILVQSTQTVTTVEDITNAISKSGTSKQQPLNLDASDENLVELMNNFKDNVYTMQQLELLFENWKSRSDVQNDMKERQKELKRIREEYKKIQEEQRKTKKGGASLKFFPGGKKKNSNANINLTQAKQQAKAEVIPDQGSGSSTPEIKEPEIEKGKPGQGSNTFWKNPHDERFFTSYVQPTIPPLKPKPPINNEVAVSDEPTSPPPPPRPAKKTSTTTAPAFIQSPPATPYVKKAAPPPPDISPKFNLSEKCKSLKKKS